MMFHAFGLNHQTAPVAVREAFALSPAAAAEIYGELPSDASFEVIILSTCNRTEVYLFGEPHYYETAVREALCRHAGAAWPADHAFSLQDEEAILHAIRVTAGVSSQVLGDAQILAQMKQAYRTAVQADRVGTVLHRLMHTAFRAAKQVRSETTLSDGAASVSSLAVRAAKLHFESTTGAGLADRSVLLVGLGQMGHIALRLLDSMGVGDITLTNRSIERARELASEVSASVIPWEERHDAAARADLVLVASAAPEPVIRAGELPPRERPALIIDVAMPRNVEPGVSAVEGYELIDLDALDNRRQATVSHRQAAIPAADEICRDHLQEFVGWVLHHEALQPALHALRDTFEAIRLQAIEQHGHRFDGADRADLDILTRSILQKLLAVPIVRLKSTDPETLDFVRGVRFLSHVFSRPGCEGESARDITTSSDVLPESTQAHPARDPEDRVDARA